MRKFLALIMVLCLLPAMALAETEGEPVNHDFGKFTMDVPADARGKAFEPVSGQPLFILYPFFDETAAHHNFINCVWTDTYADMSLLDPAALAVQMLASITASWESQGTQVENEQVLEAGWTEFDGKKALMYIGKADVDQTNAGLALKTTLYATQIAISDEATGLHSFLITTDSLEAIDSFIEIMNTIRWKA